MHIDTGVNDKVGRFLSHSVVLSLLLLQLLVCYWWWWWWRGRGEWSDADCSATAAAFPIHWLVSQLMRAVTSPAVNSHRYTL